MANADDIPATERTTYENLSAILEQLIILKRDKSTYVKSGDVVRFYDQFSKGLAELDSIRSRRPPVPVSRSPANKVDETCDDLFLLLSLFFLTVGRNNEPPATYAILIAGNCLLSHLLESGYYTSKDLANIGEKLDDVQSILSSRGEQHPKEIMKLLEEKIDVARKLVEELGTKLSDTIAPVLLPVQEQLVSLRRQIANTGSKKNPSEADLKDLEQQLNDIDNSRRGGKFVGEDGSTPDLGQNILDSLIANIRLMYSHLKNLHVASNLTEIFENLLDIRSQLERLQITQSWALRETDLYDFMKRLGTVDSGRRDGQFVDHNGVAGDGQKFLLYLLRRNFALVYILMISSEPVSEALQPIHNQLTTVRRCLLEVKSSGGISSARELYPYSMKLASIDNMRVDGKFMVGNEIPEGQGSVTALMEECFDLVHDLRVEMEDHGQARD